MVKKILIPCLLLFILVFSACSIQRTSSINATIQPTPVPPIPKTLTICLGEEPDSLYFYKANSIADQDVLQAIFDGPIDYINGVPTPVIFDKFPSLKDGSAYFSSVKVNSGDSVINTAGNMVFLQPGVQVFPSGCTSENCAIAWDGTSPLIMDFITASFKLKSNLKWSDGKKLEAADSVFSYKIASDPATPGNKIAIDQTASYLATDELSVRWTSKPGLVTDEFDKYFWTPLPEHTWGKFTASELLTSEEVNHKPIGWGAYKIEEWTNGNSIKLVKNPYYYRSNEGLPYFDTLVFKQIHPNGSAALSNLKFDRVQFQQFDFNLSQFDKEINENGCDLTTTTSNMRSQLGNLNILLNYFQDPAIKVYKSSIKENNLLLFNMRRDAPKSAASLVNPEIRKAIDLCLDTQKAVKDLSFGFYDLQNSITLAKTDKENQNEISKSFDPEKGAALLEELGWKDKDNQPNTPRISENIPGIPDGQELNFSYLVEDTEDNLKAAEIFKVSLSECGIRISLKAVPPEIYWDVLSVDSVFQGHYDMVQLSWADPITNPCLLFSSQSIPAAANNYLGMNFSGFSNPEIDTDCAQLTTSNLKDSRNDLLKKMETQINEEMPAIPLYSYSKLIVTQKNFCAGEINDKSENELSNIENYLISENCPSTN